MITKLHNLLEHQPFWMESRGGLCCSISWDLRHPPLPSATCIFPHHRALGHEELSAHASQPPVTRLEIYCGIFAPAWPIQVLNQRGVTIRDILEAVYSCLQTKFTSEEFNSLCEKQKTRVMEVFNARVQNSPFPQETWEEGMKRVDCLLQHTCFAGLSIALPLKTGRSGVTKDACIMSLRRPSSLQFAPAYPMPPALH